jgi:hypothetical protein
MRTKPFLSLLSILLPLSAQAGTFDSGGGAGVVCKNIFGGIKSVTMLDIFEGRLDGRSIPSLKINEKLQFEAAAKRLNSFADFAAGTLHDLFTNFPELEKIDPVKQGRVEGIRHLLEASKFTYPRKIVLHAPGDLGLERPIPTESGCDIMTIGFVENGRLKLTKYYDYMDETNKAAFWMHESIYRMARLRGNFTTSNGTANVRKLVAGLFASDTKLTDLVDLFAPFTTRGTKTRISDVDVRIPVVASSKDVQLVLILDLLAWFDLSEARPESEAEEVFWRSLEERVTCKNNVKSGQKVHAKYIDKYKVLQGATGIPLVDITMGDGFPALEIPAECVHGLTSLSIDKLKGVLAVVSKNKPVGPDELPEHKVIYETSDKTEYGVNEEDFLNAAAFRVDFLLDHDEDRAADNLPVRPEEILKESEYSFSAPQKKRFWPF